MFTDEELWAWRVEATLRPSSWPGTPGLPAPKAILSLDVALSCPPLSETLIPGKIQVHYVLLSGHPGNWASPHIYFMPLSSAAKTRGRWSTKGEGGQPRKGTNHCLMPVMATSKGVSADKFGSSLVLSSGFTVQNYDQPPPPPAPRDHTAALRSQQAGVLQQEDCLEGAGFCLGAGKS